MADLFKDFLAIIESADGARRGVLSPDEFCANKGCSTEWDFLDEIVSVP